MPLKLQYDSDSKTSGIQIWLHLSGYESIPFRGILTDRSRMVLPGREDRVFDMFYHINGYWSTLPRDKQVQIYLKVQEIHQCMEEIFDTQDLLSNLLDPVAELIGMHHFESVQWWLLVKGGAVIPPTVSDVYRGPEQQPGSRAQTYLRHEYEQLITLSTILRVIYPIFVMFVYKTSMTVGTSMKEHSAFKLLERSYVINHPSMDRIREYIDGCLARKGNMDLQQLFSGLSSEDIPTYILSTLVVKKICCGDVRGIGDNGQVGTSGSLSLMQVMWQTVDSLIRDRGGHSSGRVTAKKSLDKAGMGADGESTASRVELVKIATRVGIADVAIMQYAGSDAKRLARRLDPTIPDEVIDTCIHYTTANLKDTILQECKVTLTKYILSGLVNPQSLNLMYKPYVINCICAAQAVLWHKGYKTLSAILGARVIGSDEEVIHINAVTSRTRISQNVIQSLLDIYKFTIPTSCISVEDKVKYMRNSDVLQAITHLSGSITRNEWTAHLPPEWIAQVNDSALDRVIVPPPDMVSMICTLLIDIDKWYTPSVNL